MLAQGSIREQGMCISVIQKRYYSSYIRFEVSTLSKYKYSRAVSHEKMALQLQKKDHYLKINVIEVPSPFSFCVVCMTMST